MKIVETRDGSKTLFDDQYGETLRSTHGARQESYHVFLEASGVLDRLARGERTRVLEVGFGTGLNALLTLDEALAVGCPLEFVSLDKRLLAPELLEGLDHRSLLRKPSIADDVHRQLSAGQSQVELEKGVQLEFVIADATRVPFPRERFHAVYLDAFSPDVNPELWSQAFLARLHDTLLPGGRLATYCAKGSVRRALLAEGFEVERPPGPPGKREMMVGTRVAARA